MSDYRAKLIKLIHVAKRELSLSDETYQDILYVTTKKVSCSRMSIDELNKVMWALKAKGFNVKTTPNGDLKQLSQDALRGQARVIVNIWRELFEINAIADYSVNALNDYIKRMTAAKNGVGIECIQWLDADNASHVIECLKQWLNRVSSGTK